MTAFVRALFRRGDANERAKRSVTLGGEPRILFWYASQARAKAIASCRYRIGNIAEAGREISVVLAPELPRAVLSCIDALVVVRPYPSVSVRRTLAACALRGVVRIADFDDLLFAGPAEERPEVLGGRLSAAWAREAQRAYRSLLPEFDAFTVATDALSRELSETRPGARVFVVPNGLSRSWVAQGRALYPRWHPGDRRVIRFFPGSPTHDASFETVRAPLARWLDARGDAMLEVVGNLSWDVSAFPAGRARHRAAVPYEHLPELLASSWVNVWPRAEGRFNRCKSPIKFLEAAAFGCPTVASLSGVHPGLESEGLAVTAADRAFYDALERWYDDATRARAGEACMRFADERGGADRSWSALRAALEELRPRC